MARTEDPVVRSSRREALLVMFVWLAAVTYTVGYCSLYGYHRSVAEVEYVLGFPDWFFWGIVVPWVCCTIVTWAFACCGMSDESLGENADFVAGETEHVEYQGTRDV
jgi:hypothetical protein